MITPQEFKPLFYNSDGKLIVAKKNRVFTLQGDNLIPLFSFDCAIRHRLVNSFKLLRRLFRADVSLGVEYKRNYYFVYGSAMFKFDIERKTLTSVHVFPVGRGPLNLQVLEGVEGVPDGIYFGDYFGNASKKPVELYCFDGEKCNSIYTFGAGELNHIHNIIYDSYRGCIWVLAGDFGDSAAIYQSFDGLQSVERVVYGKQCFRACVAFPTEKGLVYGTDTQQEFNSIRILQESGGKWYSEELGEVNGSCIYGGETKDYYIFSTSTEPCDKKKGTLKRLLDNKPGPGIKKNQSDIVTCKKDTLSIETVLEEKKDFYPYRLFQFGAVMFPKGKSVGNNIYAYFLGGKKFDLTSIKVVLKG